MATHPDPSLNFINALSDFWTVFFRDTSQIRTYFTGVELNIGQLYLDVLETTLGTSLAHIPVFSKKYYRQFNVDEDQTFFIEGPAPEDDRFVFTPSDVDLHAVTALLNKILAPTALLENGVDYDVENLGIRFHRNPFNVDGNGNSLANFPVRVIVKTAAATYTEPAQRPFPTPAIQVGDIFRLKIGAGGAVDALITGIDGATLYLRSKRPDFEQNLKSKAYRVSILRSPYDFEKSGVQPANHPDIVQRLSANPTDVATVVGTKTVDLSAEPYYQGSWAPLTAYAEGAVVLAPGPLLVRALVAHTSPAVYDAAPWEEFSNKYLSLHLPTDPAQDGLFKITAATSPVLTLDRPTNFVSTLSNRAQAWLVGYPVGFVGAGEKPNFSLGHTFISNFQLLARRAQPVYVYEPSSGLFTEKPEGGRVEEGIDYLLDTDSGTLTVLSGWAPSVQPVANYRWFLNLLSYTYAGATPWVTATSYSVGAQVTYNGQVYICLTANSDVVFTPGNWTLFEAPFKFNQTQSVRQLAVWGTDALIDRQALYTNFGYLLGYERPSSEQYRAFLRGVSQLFVIGPALARFESALNVACNLPVVRDDGEVLHAYDSGVWASSTDGRVIDADEGRDGVLVTSGSTFSSVSTTFFSSDVGSVIRVRIGNSFSSYIVTSVLSATTVVVTPTPPDATNVQWNYSHVAFDRIFQTNSYAFSEEDLDAVLEISGASNAPNNGVFTVAAVLNASTVILDTPFNFQDETNLTWRLSRTNQQTVTTSRETYTFPFQVKMRDDVKNSANWYTLTFDAFESLTDAFLVTDYIQDPTWWHSTQIPAEVLTLAGGSAARRGVVGTLIEHRLRPSDEAAVGDVGLAVGVDDEGRPGIPRTGSGQWLGENYVDITFSPGTPGVNAQDVGRYVEISCPLFQAQFRILGILTPGNQLKLEDFPPPELRGVIPPFALNVTLPPLIYRRTVGFIMMDRYFKYHAIYVRIDPNTPITGDLFAQAYDVIKQAKPGYTYPYLETPLHFYDLMTGLDLGVTLNVGLPLLERVLAANNNVVIGPPGLLQANDTFYFLPQTQAIAGAPGTYPLTPALPVGGAPRFHVVKGWFDLTVLVGGRRISENEDYTLNRTTGVVTVINPLPGPINFNYVAVILRARTPGDGLVNVTGETAICINGADPTTWWATTQSYRDSGLIDRAVQLTIAP